MRRRKDGRNGTVLWGNMLNLYHVESVQKGVWVGSFATLTRGETRPLARKLIKAGRKA